MGAALPGGSLSLLGTGQNLPGCMTLFPLLSNEMHFVLKPITYIFPPCCSDMQGTSLEGPFPLTISRLESLTRLYVF